MPLHFSSDYDGWDVIDPGTECPDCGWVPDNPPSNLGGLLNLISDHLTDCPGWVHSPGETED